MPSPARLRALGDASHKAGGDVLLHGPDEPVRVRYRNKWGALRNYETTFATLATIPGLVS